MSKIIKDRFFYYVSTFGGFLVSPFICFMLYLPCFKGFFVIDYISYLEALFNKNNILSCFARPFISESGFRPIEALEFFACYNLFGLNPKWYLALAMLFFALSLIALYLLIFIFSKSRVLSVISCFLITAHPLHLEKFGMMCPPYLGFFFFSLSLLCYFLPLGKYKKIDIFYVLSLIFYFFAILTRADTLTVPLFILTYHLLFDRPLSQGTIIKRTVGFFLIMGLYFLIRFPILGLWLSKQNMYEFDFLNLSHVVNNYKIFTSLALRVITNPSNLISSLNLYFHDLLIFKKTIIFPVGVIILYFLTLLNKDLLWPAISKIRLKIFLLGCFWYGLGLIPFIFIADNLHYAVRHVQISMIGLAIAISIAILEIHRRIYALNRYLANSALLFVIISIFCSTFLIARRVNVDKQQYNYLGYLDMGILTKKYITFIKELYPVFPTNSQIYLVDFNINFRIPELIKIFYNNYNGRFLKVFLLSDAEFRKVSPARNGNIFVFKFIKDGKIADLTPEYRATKE